MRGPFFATAAVAALLAGAPAPLAAQTAADFCAATGRAAEAVMDARQKGVALSALMESYAQIPAEAGGDLVRAIVIAAFSVPRQESPDGRRRAAQDFRDAVELGCFQSIGGGAR